MLQVHILKTHISQYHNAMGQKWVGGCQEGRWGELEGHAYSVVISWGRLGENEKGGGMVWGGLTGNSTI